MVVEFKLKDPEFLPSPNRLGMVFGCCRSCRLRESPMGILRNLKPFVRRFFFFRIDETNINGLWERFFFLNPF